MQIAQLLKALGYDPDYGQLKPQDQFIHKVLDKARINMEALEMGGEEELSLDEVRLFQIAFKNSLKSTMSGVTDLEAQLQVAREQEQVLQKLEGLLRTEENRQMALDEPKE